MFTDPAWGRSWSPGGRCVSAICWAFGWSEPDHKLLERRADSSPAHPYSPTRGLSKRQRSVARSAPAPGKGAAVQGRPSGLSPRARSVLHLLGPAFDVLWLLVPG